MLPVSPDRRGHIDDPAGALLHHVFQRSLGHEESTRKIDGEHLLPVLVGHLGHGPVDRDPGVVYRDVESAVLVDHLAHDAPAIISVADIPMVQGDPSPWVLGGHAGHELLSPLVVAPVAGRDLRPPSARWWQMAAPIPRVPPVTRATRPPTVPSQAGRARLFPVGPACPLRSDWGCPVVAIANAPLVGASVGRNLMRLVVRSRPTGQRR